MCACNVDNVLQHCLPSPRQAVIQIRPNIVTRTVAQKQWRPSLRHSATPTVISCVFLPFVPLRRFVALSDDCAAIVCFDFTTTQTQQRQAHESPVLFYSVVMGAIGPVLAFGVSPIRLACSDIT